MPNEPICFIPVEGIKSPISEQCDTGAVLAVIANPAVEPHLIQLSTAMSSFGNVMTIVPLNHAGRIRWQEIPSPLSFLLGPPTESACVILPVSLAIEFENGEQLWKSLIDNAADVLIENPLQIEVTSERPELSPQTQAVPDWLRTHLENISITASSQPDAVALTAGLYQFHDDLHESHSYSQSIEGEGRNGSGDFWHAIMHRREPDYGNSKYWFRNVGSHPVFNELGIFATQLLDPFPDWSQRVCADGYDPFAFVDLCEASRTTPNLASAARELQWFEMLLLLKQTYLDAVGE